MMGLAMLPTFLKVFLLSERRRGLDKRRARLVGFLLRRPARTAPQPSPSAQIYTFTPRPGAAPAKWPRALP